ncbi:MAG: zinc-binding dehydrogenase [Egibacteraceae bacterium]
MLGRDGVTGERLTVEVKVPCARCRWCAAGRSNLCPSGTHVGSGIPGAFAKRLALPAALIHRVPDALPLAAAVRRAGVRSGDAVAVIGAGSVGALALYAARAEGAGQVIAVTRSVEKAALARELGVDETLDACSGSQDLADVVVECSGDPTPRCGARPRPGGAGRPGRALRRLPRPGAYRPQPDRRVQGADDRWSPPRARCFPDAIRLLAEAALE